MKISILPIFLFLGILAAQPMPPQNLILEIQLNALYLQWEPPPETQVDSYTIYRDGLELNSVDDTNYYDGDTIHDVEYCYTVTTVNPEGESEPSNMVCGAWTLNPPENLTATPTDDSIILSWTSPTEPNYLLFTISVFRDGEILVDLEPFTTSYEDEFLEANTEYCYSLTANYVEGGSQPTEEVCAIIDQPLPPQNLTLEIQIGAFYLEWEAPAETEVDYYSIYRDGLEYDTVDYTNYYDGDVEPLVEYCYFVTCVNDDGESEPSETVCGSWALNPPTNLRARTTDDSILLTWDEAIEPNDLLFGYEVYRDGNFLDMVGAPSTSYEDSYPQANHNTEYCYFIVAQYDAGMSEPTDEVCAEWNLPSPNNFAIHYSLNGFQLQWEQDMSPEFQFVENLIYRNDEFYVTTEDGFYFDQNIEYGDTYCYAVSALFEIGESPLSETICIDFQLLPPTNFNAVSEDDHIRLTWDAPDPFYGWYQGVNIFRDGYFLDFTEEYLTFYDDFQVADSDIYCYTLEAIYDEGTSELTEEICIVHTEPNLITLQGTVVYVPNLMECTCNEFILEGDPGYPSLATGTDVLGVVFGLQHLGQHLQITGEESFFQCYDAINE